MVKTIKIFASILLLFFCGCNSKAQTDKQTQIDNLFDKATQADSIGDYKKSIEIYNQILAIDTDYGGALVNRGRAYIFLGDSAQGFIDLNNAVKYHPHEEFYSERGAAYLYFNQLDSAEKDFKAALKLNPLCSKAYYFLCTFHLVKGEYYPALYSCELADKYGMNERLSTVAKAEMSKVLSNDIVTNYNSDTILKTIKNLPLVKKAEEKSLTENKSGLNFGTKLIKSLDWIYLTTVRKEYGGKILWEFKIDAATLKVLNPDGTN